MFRSLKHRNFRLFIGGQGISLTGTWMQQIAMCWLVYRLTGSALLLGTVGFLGQLPAFLFSPIAGVMADRYDKRKMLIIVQSLAMIQAFILAALVLSGKIEIWHIIAMSILLGFANAFDMPIRQSFMIEMLGGREDLSNAIALNSSIVNAARILGPSLAGILVAAVGEGLCFLLNGLSFIAVLIALYAMDIAPLNGKPRSEKLWTELKAGYSYLAATPPLLHIILLLGVVSLFGMSFQVLMPVYVKDVLHGGPKTLGFLMSVMGAGALTSTVLLASQKDPFRFLKLISTATVAFGFGLVLISQVGALAAALLGMSIVGTSIMAQLVSSNTTLQTIAEDRMRGRVMAYYTMAFLGLAPFGSLYAGTLAQSLGVQRAFLIGGLICASAGAVFASRISALRNAGKL